MVHRPSTGCRPDADRDDDRVVQPGEQEHLPVVRGDDAVDRSGDDDPDAGDDPGGGEPDHRGPHRAELRRDGRHGDGRCVAADAQRDEQEEQPLPGAVLLAGRDDVDHPERHVLLVRDRQEDLLRGARGRLRRSGRDVERRARGGRGVHGGEVAVADLPLGVLGRGDDVGDERAVGLVGDGLGEHLGRGGLPDDADGQLLRRGGVEGAEVGESHAGGQEQRHEDVRGEGQQHPSEAGGAQDAVGALRLRGPGGLVGGGVVRVRRRCRARGRGVDGGGRRKVVLCNFRHEGPLYNTAAHVSTRGRAGSGAAGWRWGGARLGDTGDTPEPTPPRFHNTPRAVRRGSTNGP